jgi:SAM-dependent methyltransferase
MERYTSYDPLAWYYNRDWGREFHAEALGALRKLAFSRLPRHARVLDLCCGTGDLTRSLVAHGYRVTGLDGSEQMLGFARENVPEAEFILGDARDFVLPPVFDGALSTYDSLNHILSLAELRAAFQNVHCALRPGGLFVFDLNLEEKFRTLWRGSHPLIEDQAVSITRAQYHPAQKIGRVDITVFRLEETHWQRCDVCVFEKCYSEEEVRSGLAQAGFRGIRAYDAQKLGMQSDIGLGRAFFFALKPRGPS